MRETNSTVNRYNTAAAVVTALAVMAAALVFFHLTGLVNMPLRRLDDQIITQITRSEASKRGFFGPITGLIGEQDAAGEESEASPVGMSAGDRAASEPLYAGDRMTASFRLPEAFESDDSALCFHMRSSVVRISVDGEERAVYGLEALEKGEQIGDLLIRFPLTGKDAGREVVISAMCAEGRAEAVLSDVLLIGSTDAAKYPLIGHETKLLLLTALLLISLILFVYSVICAFMRRRFLNLFLLSAAVFLGAAAVYGKSLFFSILLTGGGVTENAGIMAGYAAPAVFYLYLWRATSAGKKVRRSIYLAVGILFAAGFGALLFLHFTRGIHPAAFDGFAEYIFAASLAFSALVETAAGSKKGAEEDGLLRGGIRIMLILLLIELARQNIWRLQESSTFGQYFPKVDYIACAVIAASCMFLLHQFRLSAGLLRREENAVLMKDLAYTDILSGIPNRHYCDRKLAAITKTIPYTQTPAEYTIFILNVDSMHEINEKQGYETGDEVIRRVAESVHDAMRGCGADIRGDIGPVAFADSSDGESADCFYGRWGGDEFAACTFRSQADAFQTTFASRIAAVNIEKQLPIPISVSVGSCDFRSGSYEAAISAIERASGEMAERKALLNAEPDRYEVL